MPDTFRPYSIRWMSFLFVSAQILLCYIIGAADRGRIIAACILGVSLASTVLKAEIRLPRSLHTLLLMCSGLLFSSVTLSRFFSIAGTGLLELFELLAEFLIVVQALELVRNRSSDMSHYWMNNYLPGLGALVLILLLVSRDIALSLSALNYYFAGAIILIVLVMRPDFFTLLIGNRLQKRKAITLSLIVAITLVTGGLFRSEVSRQLPRLQALLTNQQPTFDVQERRVVTTSARFVDRISLTNITATQQANPDEMVFRAEAVKVPGYMRTLTFDQFDGQNWFNAWTGDRRTSQAGARRIAPLTTIPSNLELSIKSAEGDLFALNSSPLDRYEEMKVSVPINHGRLVPLPLTASLLLAEAGGRARQLVIDSHGNIWPNSVNNRDYRVYLGNELTMPVEEDYLLRLLQIPTEDSQFLRRFGDRICSSQKDVRGKINSVKQYFKNNFSYSFESDAIGELRGRSPLRAFLENQKAGHCEYFATASVLLLRSQGIPSRLSSGYLVYEMDDDKEYFFVRNRDAHAWAEAFDEEKGEWVLVESTPGIDAITAQFQQQDENQNLANSNDAADQQSISANLWQSLVALQSWFTHLASLRFAWILPVLIASSLLIARMKRTRHSLAHHYVSRSVRQADRAAARLGFHRSHHETCSQFAVRLFASSSPRLQEMGRWYLDHSQTRYVLDHSKMPEL